MPKRYTLTDTLYISFPSSLTFPFDGSSRKWLGGGVGAIIRFVFDGNSIPVRMMSDIVVAMAWNGMVIMEFCGVRSSSVMHSRTKRKSREAKATDRRFNTELTNCLSVDEIVCPSTNRQ